MMQRTDREVAKELIEVLQQIDCGSLQQEAADELMREAFFSTGGYLAGSLADNIMCDLANVGFVAYPTYDMQTRRWMGMKIYSTHTHQSYLYMRGPSQ